MLISKIADKNLRRYLKTWYQHQNHGKLVLYLPHHSHHHCHHHYHHHHILHIILKDTLRC